MTLCGNINCAEVLLWQIKRVSLFFGNGGVMRDTMKLIQVAVIRPILSASP